MLQKQEIHCWIEQRSKTIPFFLCKIALNQEFLKTLCKIGLIFILEFNIFQVEENIQGRLCVGWPGARYHLWRRGASHGYRGSDPPSGPGWHSCCPALPIPPASCGVTRFRETTADDDTKAEIRYFRFYYNWRWSLTLVDGCVSARFGTIIHCCVS